MVTYMADLDLPVGHSPEQIMLWGEKFGKGAPELASRYGEALQLFLGTAGEQDEWSRHVGSLSPSTRRCYAFALAELFQWLAVTHQRMVTPNEVTTADAQDFTLWLANRPWTLDEERLKAKPERDRYAIYQAVRRLGEPTQSEIAAALPPEVRRRHLDRSTGAAQELDEDWLQHELGRMVLHDLLERRPTLERLRRWPVDAQGEPVRPEGVPAEIVGPHPGAGLKDDTVEVSYDGRSRRVPLSSIWRYRVPPPAGVGRVTIRNRLGALSLFWELLLRAGLVTSNPWFAVKRRASSGLKRLMEAAAAEQRALVAEPELVVRLLRAAEDARSLDQYRDKAMVYLFVFGAFRTGELVRLRRGLPPESEKRRWPGWFDGREPPSLVLLRKGEQEQTLPYPPIALRALTEFQASLNAAAAGPGTQSTDPSRADYASPGAFRLRDLATQPDAPLFPPVRLWGANSPGSYEPLRPNAKGLDYRRSMSRHGVSRALKRLAARAGMTSAQAAKVHPHALRHFSLSAMAAEGKDLREIQAIAGHGSVTTTEGYLEQPAGRVALSGQAEVMQFLSKHSGPIPEPSAAIETTGREAAEPSARASIEPQEPTATEAPAEVAAAPELAQAVSEERLPLHTVPLMPEHQEPEIKSVSTAVGRATEIGEQVIGIDGEEPSEQYAIAAETQLVDGKSAGEPDATYEAMEQASKAIAAIAEAQRSGNQAAERAARAELGRVQLEPIAFTSAYPRQRSGGASIEVREEKGQKRELVQRNRWLAEHYDPWPIAYGIGQSSLLTWFQKGSPAADGYLKPKGVWLAPLPVLAPAYCQPETELGRAFLDDVQALYDRWLTGDGWPTPTRAFGLLRWVGFFTYTTAKLQAYLREHQLRLTWRPWGELCELGSSLRAHQREWIARWLELNAHTFTTSVRALKHVPRGKSLRHEEEFWEAFTRASFEGVTSLVEIPSWFAEDDPIGTLPPAEYDSFANWLGNVTGQRLSRARATERVAQQGFAQQSVTDDLEQVKGLLEDVYYPTVSEIAEARRSEVGTELIEGLQATLRHIEERLVELGAPDPRAAEFAGISDRRERMRAILKRMAEQRPGAELAERNLFADSRLFDPEMFRINRGRHTISHTAEFKRDFFEKFGVDSELVVRRAARAMWESVKRRRLATKQLSTDEYNYLYSIFLNYLAWIVPAGEQMERAIAESAEVGLAGGKARRAWLERHVATVRSLLYEEVLPEAEEAEQELSFDQQVQWVMEQQGLDRASAEAAVKARDLIQTFGAEQARGVELESAGVAELLLRSGAGRTFTPSGAGPGGSEGPLRPNVSRLRRGRVGERSIRVERLVGERPATLYELAHDYEPNAGPRSYFSLGVWRRGYELTANQRSVLPSPLTMIHAMTLD
jgi:integrase